MRLDGPRHLKPDVRPGATAAAPAGDRADDPAAFRRDSHAEQARRVADLCAGRPGEFFSLAELATACDLGSASKVLSTMAATSGYVVTKEWRRAAAADGARARRVRVYRVTGLPAGAQLDLPLR